MKDFLINLFKGPESKITMRAFDGWHFGYIALILALIIGAMLLLKRKSEKVQKKALNILSIVTLVFYIFDFFIQPFIRNDFTLNIDKLPFHICTLMGIIAVFAQFSNKNWFKQIAVLLAMAGSIMYIVYPGTALNGKAPWSYVVVQTEFYHGMLLAWGFLNVSLKQVKLRYKDMWMPLVGLLVVALWATLGNFCYNTNYAGGNSHYDWMFLTGSSFGVSPYIMPLITITCIYSVIACMYLINFVCEQIAKRKNIN